MGRVHLTQETRKASPSCRFCFMECEVAPRGHGSPYPCTSELRLWANAHRNDEGDELGYVWEAVA